MNTPLNHYHYPAIKPNEWNTQEILDSVRRPPTPQPFWRIIWDRVEVLLGFIIVEALFVLLYFPLARGLAWLTLVIGNWAGYGCPIPVYTPYPPL